MLKSILLSLLICSSSLVYAHEYKTYTGTVVKVEYPNYYFSFTAPCKCPFCPQPHQFTVKVESDDKVPPTPIEGETCTIKLRIEREKGCHACLKKEKVRYVEAFRYNPRYVHSKNNIFKGKVLGIVRDVVDLGDLGRYDYALVEVKEYICGQPWEMVYVAFKENEYEVGQEYIFDVVKFESSILSVNKKVGVFRLEDIRN